MTPLANAVLLALVAGWADATGYLAAKTFAAQMTGNTALFGLALARLDGPTLARLALTLLAFLSGLLLSSLAANTRAGRRAALAACATALLALSLHAHLRADIPLLALALGAQNAAFRDFGGQTLNTSFLSGDLQTLAAAASRRLRGKSRGKDGDSLRLIPPLWSGYAAGAACSALWLHHVMPLTGFGRTAFLIPAILLAVIAARAP